MGKKPGPAPQPESKKPDVVWKPAGAQGYLDTLLPRTCGEFEP